MMQKTSLRFLLFLVLSVSISACGPRAAPYEPPDGWVAEDDRWWQSGADTSDVYRDLETFEAMNIPMDEASLRARLPSRHRDATLRMQLINSVRGQLIRMYRNQPEVVDSVFVRHVVPVLIRAERPAGQTFEDERQARSRDAFREISRYFRQPRTRLTLGDDIPMTYPDSLRRQGIGGTVNTQVYLNQNGEPVAIEKLEGVHPILDGIAMRATTQMRWHPAYLAGRPIPAWARFQVTFRQRPEG